ncbi:hypothetical protein [Aestuariivita boseongensis]|uniref:hypothetical protein n=1 Tax=Aestuariivita boseongensis TaxID=1470562 RepID=UPI000681EB90|nr:hypothetical protein [Aestuariivita boseongensis]
MSDAIHPQAPRVTSSWGFWAVICGVVAMVLVLVQMQVLSSQESVPIGQQIGEIAGDIKRSAWRSFLGLSQPEREPVPVSLSQQIFQYLFYATPVIGGIAIVLAMVSLIKQENWRLGFYAVTFGGGAILMQYMWWMVLIFLGFLLLVKIVENIGDIFSF